MQCDELGDVLFIFDQEDAALAHVKDSLGRRDFVLSLRRLSIIDRKSHGIITVKTVAAPPCAVHGQESIGSGNPDARDRIVETMLLRQV
jgi:hypothetical protein